MSHSQDYYVNVVNSEPIPVTLGSDTITITGNVNVGTTVSVDSSPENPVHVHVTEIPEVEIKNDSGNPIPVEWVYGNSVSAIPWELQVARGKISGVTGLSIAGYNASVGTQWAAIWEYATPYVYLPSAQTLRVWSNSASDTNLYVLINGLDASYNPISETVHLTNGTTGVMTTNSYFRIQTMNLTTSTSNVGNISIGKSDKTITCATIMPDAGRSQMCVYTVPAGYTFYLTQANILTNQVGSQTATYRSYTKDVNGVTNSIIIFPFVDIYNSRKVCARPYAEKTDIQWQAQASNGTSAVGGQIEGFLIANSVA
jgi:hypothetical protein